MKTICHNFYRKIIFNASALFTIEIVYYTLLLITSYIYLKKAKWQNKKI